MTKTSVLTRTSIAVLCLGSLLWGAEGVSSKEPGNSESLATASAAKEVYKLGPGDEIRVQQPNVEDLEGRTFRLDERGFATFPLIGRMELGDKTIEEAEAVIAKGLAVTLVNPHPVISVVQYRDQSVSVLGSVNTPGLIQVRGGKRLADVLSMAGGLRADAGHDIQIVRAPGKGESMQVEVSAILAGGEERNMLILPGDVITVQKASMIYVTGDVRRPGAFPVASTGISVLKAVALAEGLVPSASARQARILRQRGAGESQEEIRVDISKIMAAKIPDMEMKPNDVLVVPDSMSRKAGVRAAEAAFQTLTGIVIWRR